jgi:hypothetical protein
VTTGRVPDAAPAPASEAGILLLGEVEAARAALDALRVHAEVLDPGVVARVAAASTDVQRRLTRPGLHVAVVGEQKSGKSTFLNAFIGARLLGAAARECTGTVTRIRKGPHPHWEARTPTGALLACALPDRRAAFAHALAGARTEREATEIAAAAAQHALAAASAAVHAAVQAHAATREVETSATSALAAAAEEVAHTSLVRAQEDASLREVSAPLPWFLRGSGLIANVFALLLGWIWSEERQRFQAAHRVLEASEAAWANAEAVRRDRAAASDAARSGLAQAAAEESARRADAEAAGAARAAADAARFAAQARVADEERARIAWEQAHARAVADEVAALGDMTRRGREVAALDVTWPARFPDSLVLLDTPGVNTDDAENQARAWAAIRDEADGCVLVSDLTQAVSQTTRDFLGALAMHVPHVVLVLTKLDRAREAAAFDGGDGADAQLAQARRVATRRFAESLGRDRDDVFVLAVAAEPALRGEPTAVAAFEEEMNRLTHFLAEERGLVVAARCASALETVGREIDAAVAEAEARYRARIALLEAQRIPEPGVFRAEQLAAIAPRIARLRTDLVAATRETASSALDGVRIGLLGELAALPNKDAVEAWTRTLGARLPVLVTAALEGAHPGTALREAGLAVEDDLLATLRERYRIVGELAGARGMGAAVQLAGGDMEAPVTALGEVLAGHVQTQIGMGAGGALVGATLGTLLFPGVGTVVGALLGGLASFLVTVDDLKRDCAKPLEAWFVAQEPDLASRAAERTEANVTAVETTLAARLDAELATFARWIADVTRQEKAALAAERARRADLDQAGRHASEALRALERAREAAGKASRALCAAVRR